VIHVDDQPANIERHLDVDLGIVGDARTTTEAVVAELDSNDIDFAGKFWTDNVRRRIADESPFVDREFSEMPGTIDPRDLIEALDPMLPEDRVVLYGAGHFLNWVLDGITISNPNDFIWPGVNFGAIGIGLPIGLGAAAGVTNRIPLLFCGDGGLMMSISEIETAARHDIPAIVVVLNDEALGAEYRLLESADGYTDAAAIEAPDFAEVARSFGADGHTVRSVDDLNAIRDRLDSKPDGPVVVDCKVNRNVRHRFYDSVH
jgi:thiamine pyrophosphate-dependent acetolactate synthase large subunit-like protein